MGLATLLLFFLSSTTLDRARLFGSEIIDKISVYSRRYSGGGGIPDELNFAGGFIYLTQKKRNSTLWIYSIILFKIFHIPQETEIYHSLLGY